ncbi:DUF1295 domain-containing protein [Flammeovirga pacifica]|uniref:Uncharacterized protein n=1 Tax=Flammeovirga pacifica TaxID=915059 RepID=A0A1S1Z484_FLAPC|nr:DUF1295 domain-containing protein [Flammeovirga pacifica]OHX68098.1 hypothetical protein NH26_17975 [Flammeovirga pacifica]
MTDKQKAILEITIIYIIIGVSGILSYQYIDVGNKIWNMFVADVVMTVVCYIFSVIKKNTSTYDAYWSVIPFYLLAGCYFFLHGDKWGTPQWVAAFVISFWSWRLTLSWARGWPGWHHEDFRYVNFRNKFGKVFEPINFLALHFYPTVIVFLSFWGMIYVFDLKNSLFGLKEVPLYFYLGALIAFLGGVFELLADNELDKFRKRPNPQKSDILKTGIWGRSRNPNYLGEMMFWFGLAIMAYAFNAPWYAALGSVGMWAMFMFASIPLKDAQMMKNRPEAFKKYKEEVSRVLPF